MVTLRKPRGLFVAVLLTVALTTVVHAAPQLISPNIGSISGNGNAPVTTEAAGTTAAGTTPAGTTPAASPTQEHTAQATTAAPIPTPTPAAATTPDAHTPSADTPTSAAPTSAQASQPAASSTEAKSRASNLVSASPIVSKLTLSNSFGAVTSYVTINATISTPTATSTPASSAIDNSLNQLLTAGIALGAVIIAAAIGLWIFRKWKLGPSKRFAEKLNSNTDYNNYPSSRQESDTVFLRELNY